MSRTVTAILAVLGILLFGSELVAPMVVPEVQRLATQMYANGWIFVLFGIWELSGLALLLAAYVGALVKLSRLHQTRWIWVMGISLGLIITVVGAIVPVLALLAYSFFGPTTAATPSAS
jgi:hypothetical protein